MFPWGSCTDNWLIRPESAEAGKFAKPLALKPSFCPLSIMFTDPDIGVVGSGWERLDPDTIVVGSAEGSGNGRSKLEISGRMIRKCAK